MVQMEGDLETILDWVAIDHYNTRHPPTSIVIRGVTDQGNQRLHCARDPTPRTRDRHIAAPRTVMSAKSIVYRTRPLAAATN
jgi:type IV secretory pathway VirD2 relaxase